ncbi:hypothetical protein JCGZ_02459 [Jatropha curcas]|uniref:Uncharacterized protein n=1 Tax=Jatropha curcas TaxID=180498 RepID=A0A067JRZ9_JATCU|nr:hypothetical protein JCGZ_02459 [Jatropha curcas]
MEITKKKMEKRWKSKVDEGDEDKDEEMKMKWNSWSTSSPYFSYIPFYPTLDSNGSNRVLDQPDSTLSNDSIQ